MKRSIIHWLAWSITSFVVLFVYFWWLNWLGQQHAKQTSPYTETSVTYLKKNWKFKTGDDSRYALSGFNDSTWQTVKSDSLPKNYTGEIA